MMRIRGSYAACDRWIKFQVLQLVEKVQRRNRERGRVVHVQVERRLLRIAGLVGKQAIPVARETAVVPLARKALAVLRQNRVDPAVSGRGGAPLSGRVVVP